MDHWIKMFVHFSGLNLPGNPIVLLVFHNKKAISMVIQRWIEP